MTFQWADGRTQTFPVDKEEIYEPSLKMKKRGRNQVPLPDHRLILQKGLRGGTAGSRKNKTSGYANSVRSIRHQTR